MSTTPPKPILPACGSTKLRQIIKKQVNRFRGNIWGNLNISKIENSEKDACRKSLGSVLSNLENLAFLPDARINQDSIRVGRVIWDQYWTKACRIFCKVSTSTKVKSSNNLNVKTMICFWIWFRTLGCCHMLCWYVCAIDRCVSFFVQFLFLTRGLADLVLKVQTNSAKAESHTWR